MSNRQKPAGVQASAPAKTDNIDSDDTDDDLSVQPPRGPVTSLPSSSQAASGTLSESLQAKQQEFDTLALKLNLDTETAALARKTLMALYERYPDDMKALTATQWGVLALYIAGRSNPIRTVDETGVAYNGVSVTKLMETGAFTTASFIRHLGTYMLLSSCPAEMVDHVKKLQTKFDILALVFNKFKKLFAHIFKDASAGGPPIPGIVHEFAWSFFLLAKANTIGGAASLVDSITLLLPTLNFIRCVAPKEWLNDANFDPNTETGRLESLSHLHDFLCGPAQDASFTEYTSMTERYGKGFLQNLREIDDLQLTPFIQDIAALKKTRRILHFKDDQGHEMRNQIIHGDDDDWPYSAHQSRRDPAADQEPVVPILSIHSILEPGFIDTNLQNVRRAYEILFMESGGFDERALTLPTSARPATSTPKKQLVHVERPINDHVRRNLGMADIPYTVAPDATPLTGRSRLPPRAQPAPGSPPPTPISNALKSAGRLNHLLYTDGDDMPLRKLLEECGLPAETMDTLEKTLEEDRSKFVDQFTKDSQSEEGHQNHKAVRRQSEQRFLLSRKLYYRIMFSILDSERKRLGERANRIIQTLLAGDLAHLVLACSIELVLYCFQNQVATFPWVLRLYDIPSYSFFKIVDSVVRHEPLLDRSMIKHLNILEERIIEELAWVDKSPVYDAIARFGSVPTSSKTLPPQNPLESPLPPRFGMAHLMNGDSRPSASVGSPGGISSPSKLAKTTPLELFFRKVYYAMTLRLTKLCERLSSEFDKLRINSPIFKKIWTAIEHTFTHHIDLIKDRHIDQIMICCVFAVCKTNHIPITFSKITAEYRVQPQGNPHIFRSVLMKSGTAQRESIIRFYNEVFVTELKAFLNRDHPSSELLSPPNMDLYNSIGADAGNSPRKPLPGVRLTVKGHEQSTPRTRRLLASPSDSPSHHAMNFEIGSPNSSGTLNGINQRQASAASRRLNFDDDAEAAGNGRPNKLSRIESEVHEAITGASSSAGFPSPRKSFRLESEPMDLAESTTTTSSSSNAGPSAQSPDKRRTVSRNLTSPPRMTSPRFTSPQL